MKKTYLIDTCVWRDFYENRFSRSNKPLGLYAYNFFVKILNNKEEIIFSETLIRELKKDYFEKEITDMLRLLVLNHSLIRIKITKEEYIEAKQLSKDRNVPFVDCVNAIHARNHNAILITQDKHFFNNLSDITKAVKPQNII
jgi:predicted nucleic acid-binding protein